MTTRRLPIGSIFLAVLAAASVGQLQAAEAKTNSEARARLAEVIKKVLAAGEQENDAKARLELFRVAVARVTKDAASNQLIGPSLRSATAAAAKQNDPAESASVLRTGLRDAESVLTFKLVIEAPLPEGFPEPTPLGDIAVKKYPAYRLARTPMSGETDPAFWRLFTHIKKNDIAMTAPVELTFDNKPEEKPKETAMAFMYRTVDQKSAVTDKNVEVADVPAMTTVSIGMRGNERSTAVAEARELLKDWLKLYADRYRVAGPLRVMGYNSPFVTPSRRYFEVEIPVREKKAEGK